MSNPMFSVIYSGKAELYDLLYSYKNYGKESIQLHTLIEKYKKSDGNTLLDVGCGTGQHIKELRKWYDCTGVDISVKLIRIAMARNKGTSFHIDDMTHFDLRKTFDVLICLFGSIGYVDSYVHFLKVLENFYNHLNHGGIAVIEPWFSKEDKDFKVNTPFMTTFEEKDLKVSRISIAKIKGNFSYMDTHYLVGNGSIQHFNEKEKLLLISHENFLKGMKQVGFTAMYLKKGLSEDDRGLYIGIK